MAKMLRTLQTLYEPKPVYQRRPVSRAAVECSLHIARDALDQFLQKRLHAPVLTMANLICGPSFQRQMQAMYPVDASEVKLLVGGLLVYDIVTLSEEPGVGCSVFFDPQTATYSRSMDWIIPYNLRKWILPIAWDNGLTNHSLAGLEGAHTMTSPDFIAFLNQAPLRNPFSRRKVVQRIGGNALNGNRLPTLQFFSLLAGKLKSYFSRISAASYKTIEYRVEDEVRKLPRPLAPALMSFFARDRGGRVLAGLIEYDEQDQMAVRVSDEPLIVTNCYQLLPVRSQSGIFNIKTTMVAPNPLEECDRYAEIYKRGHRAFFGDPVYDRECSGIIFRKKAL